MNVSDAEKRLSQLKKKIENTQRDVDTTTEKLERAKADGAFKMGVLDAEKAKLQEIKDQLSDLKSMSKDKSVNFDTRERYKALIPGVQQELSDQKIRVNALQSEWNKVQNSVDRYEQKINDSAAKLTQQIDEAGNLQRQINEAQAEVSKLVVSDQKVVDLNKELLKLKERQKELESLDVGYGFEEYDQNAKRISEITEEIKEYQKALTGAAKTEKEVRKSQPSTRGGEDAQSRLTAYLEKSNSIYQKLSSMIGKTTEMSGVLSEMAEATGGTVAKAFQVAGVAAQEFGAVTTAALASVAPYLLVISLAVQAIMALKNATDKAMEEAKEKIQARMQQIAAIGETVKEFLGSVISAAASVGKKILPLAKNLNVFSKIAEKLNGKFKRLGSTIKSALVFSVIYKGLSLIRQQVASYLNVNAEFTTALRRMQGVLLTAFQPVYDVVVPALTTLINVLARAAATVTQFFASLFGTTAKQAQTNAKDLYDQANATTAAGDAAEEAAKQLAGFDEINKLEGSKSAGGGGSTSVDTGPLFDYEYEETPFDSWGEAFSAFLDKLLNGIPKLRDVFKDFAGWLNNWSKKLYDMFTFPGVLDKVKQLGRDLADALNDLVNWIEWEQLGRALGAGLNLALNFLTSFIYEFDWMNLGRKLAEFINGIVYEIEWIEFGRLLWAGFKIGLETFAGFILGLDMPALAEAASNIIIGFFTEMKNTIDRIPWGEIGQQIADFLANLKWYEMLSKATDAIAAGLMAAVIAVRGFLNRIVPELDRIAKEIVTALTEFFRDKVQWDEMARTIGDGITAALSFIAGLLDPNLFYEIGKAVGDFFINLRWVEIFGGLTEVLANGINSAIAALKGFLDRVTPEKLKEVADGIAQKIEEFVDKVEWKDLGETISRGIETALDFLIEFMQKMDENGTWDKIGQAIVDCLSAIDWDTLLSKWGTLLGEAMNAKMKMIDLSGALDIGMNIVSGLAKGMWNKFQESGGILGWLKRTFIDNLLGGVFELLGIHSPSTVFAEIGGYLIAGLAQGISDTWHSIIDFFSGALENLKQFFSDAWENIQSTASEKWENIRSALSDTWDMIRTAAQEKFDAVKEKIGETWDNIKQKASGTWENIKSDLSAKWDNIKSTAESKFNGIKEKISTIWENVKTEAAQKWEEIKTKLSTTWDTVKGNAQEKFTNIKQAIIDKMGELKDHDWLSIGKNIMNGIWDGLKSVWDSITRWVKNAADGIASAFSGASAPRNSSGTASRGGSFGGTYRMAIESVPDISNFNIPRLAQGAVIPPNREFLAVLGDQRSGNNLEGPESAFEAAVMRGIQKAGGLGGNRPITVILQVDKRELGRVVYEVNNSETQRVGVRLAEAHT